MQLQVPFVKLSTQRNLMESYLLLYIFIVAREVPLKFLVLGGDVMIAYHYQIFQLHSILN